jgi:hypothetical protein
MKWPPRLPLLLVVGELAIGTLVLYSIVIDTLLAFAMFVISLVASVVFGVFKWIVFNSLRQEGVKIAFAGALALGSWVFLFLKWKQVESQIPKDIQLYLFWLPALLAVLSLLFMALAKDRPPKPPA